jgi:hypothetical protein
MWEELPRYQWLPLCGAGTQTDPYWAIRIDFADQMLGSKEQPLINALQVETPPHPPVIERPPDIDIIIALRQIKLQQLLESITERLPPSKREINQHLQQRLISVWSKLPAKVVDSLVKAENYYRTGVNSDDAKVWFNKAVEASLDYCFVEPLVSFVEKRVDKRIAICFPPPRGVEHKTLSELRKLSLSEWSDVFNTRSVREGKTLGSLGAEELERFMKQHFGEVSLPALGQLSRSLRDFWQPRKGNAHYHTPRHEEERQELE